MEYRSVTFLFISLIIVGCASDSNKMKSIESSIDKIDSQMSTTEGNNGKELIDSLLPNYFNQYDHHNLVEKKASHFIGMKLKRKIGGEYADIELTGYSRGEAFHTLFSEKFPNFSMRRIWELNPGVLVYEEPPHDGRFEYELPLKIEFIDTLGASINLFDILKNSPYKPRVGKKFTYKNFDAEAMRVIPYKKQNPRIKDAQEESLFIRVTQSGLHILINYELRDIKDEHDIVAFKNTVIILNEYGEEIHRLEDLSSFDTGAVSEDGKYVMYKFGGDHASNANQSMINIERPGFVILDLDTKKEIYSEYTDDGLRAFSRIWLEQGFLRIGFSTPSDSTTLSDYGFFDPDSGVMYRKMITERDWINIKDDFIKSGRSYRFYVERLRFHANALVH